MCYECGDEQRVSYKIGHEERMHPLEQLPHVSDYKTFTCLLNQKGYVYSRNRRDFLGKLFVGLL
jgi:hypothetical protein